MSYMLQGEAGADARYAGPHGVGPIGPWAGCGVSAGERNAPNSAKELPLVGIEGLGGRVGLLWGQPRRGARKNPAPVPLVRGRSRLGRWEGGLQA